MFRLFLNVNSWFFKSCVDFSILFLFCTVVLVLGCNWPYLAVVKHVNKLIELNWIIILLRQRLVDVHIFFGLIIRANFMVQGLPWNIYPVAQLVKKFLAFMKSDGIFPCSKKLVIGPYPELINSSSPLYTYPISMRPILILSSHLCPSLWSSVFRPTFCSSLHAFFNFSHANTRYRVQIMESLVPYLIT
jgi:hypothetical protein